MKTPKLSRADRRKAIVDAAGELFAERGFRGVTTRELAQRVGVTEPVLYEHFHCKRDLYNAIIDCTSRENFERARDMLRDSARTDAPRVFFIKLASLIVEHQVKNPNYLRLILFSALERHELAQLCFERHASVIHEIIIGYIKDQASAGVFRTTDAEVATRAFTGMVLHYSIFELQFGFKTVKASQKRVIETMVDIFLGGMKMQ